MDNLYNEPRFLESEAILDDILGEQEAMADARAEDSGQVFADKFAAMARGEHPPEQPENAEAPEKDPDQAFADNFAEMARAPRDAFND